MDLSRWNLPQITKIRDFFDDVLEGERELIRNPNKSASVTQPFSASNDWDELDRELSLLKPGSSPEKILSCFGSYFEGAMCLRTDKNSSILTSVVLFDQVFSPPDAKGAELNIGIAGLKPGYVVHGRVVPILRALKIETIEQLHDCEAFAFSPAKNVIFVLFCSRPHPWQVSALENAYLSARDAFQRLEPKNGSTGLRAGARSLFK